MHANELGMNIAYDSSGSLKYVLLGLNGERIRDAVIANGFSSGWLRPAITSILNGNREDMMIFYRYLDSVKVSISTDAGKSWNYGPSILAQSSLASNRMDAVSEGISIHVTWDTGTLSEQSKVHYAMLDFSTQPPYWTGEYTSTLGEINGVNVNGRQPQIVISPNNSVHLVYITQKVELDSLGNEYTYNRLVHRERALSSSIWDSVDVVARLYYTKETINTEIVSDRHCDADFSSPSSTSSDSCLFIAAGYNNTQPSSETPDKCPGNKKFRYSYSYRDPLDVAPNDSGLIAMTNNYPQGKDYPRARNHALLFSEDSLFWAWVRNQEPMEFRKSDGTLTSSFQEIMSIQGADLPYLSLNNESKIIMSFVKNGYFNGYRLPRDIATDIDRRTYYTSKNRIKQETHLNLLANVPASIYDTLILDIGSSLTLLR